MFYKRFVKRDTDRSFNILFCPFLDPIFCRFITIISIISNPPAFFFKLLTFC